MHHGGQEVIRFGGGTIRKMGVFTPETVSGTSRDRNTSQ